METSILGKLESEINKLFYVIDRLKVENEELKREYHEALNNHRKDKELIKSIRSENAKLSNISRDKGLKEEEKTKIKEGLEKIIIRLDSLL